MVFTRQQIAVFIDGCYWHSCPLHGSRPQRNRDYWNPKLEGNRLRDADTNSALISAGWSVMRFWEHEEVNKIADAIVAAVKVRSNSTVQLDV